MSDRRTDYLRSLAEAIDHARQIADEWPQPDGWGGGFSLDDAPHFGYGNTSDLLSDLAARIEGYIAKEGDRGS